MPFQETSKEKGQKHIGQKPFAFDMCRLVQTTQKGEEKPTLQTWLEIKIKIKIKIMPEDHSSQLEFLQKSGGENPLRRCLGFEGPFCEKTCISISICRRETKAQ